MRDLHGLGQARRPRGVHVENCVGGLDLRGNPIRLLLAAAPLDLLVEKEGAGDGRHGRQVNPRAGETVVELKLVLLGRLELLLDLNDCCGYKKLREVFFQCVIQLGHLKEVKLATDLTRARGRR